MNRTPSVTTDPAELVRALATSSSCPRDRPATMRAALLVNPTGFRVSSESAVDNRYMRPGVSVDLERAHAQHAAVVRALVDLGVPVVVFPGREGLDDGVYPNNVFGTAPGRFIVGSMRHPGRRREAERGDVRALFSETFGYRLHDLSGRSCIAELTGPLAIDRARGIGFCGLTQRVDAAGCEAMHDAFDLRLTLRFDLVPGEYHTNLVLAILAGRGCVIDPAAFVDPRVVEAIAGVYSGRTLRLSPAEKEHYAGNCIAVTETDVLFSQTALKALRPESVRELESWGFRLHGVRVDELEKGGGSLRCLIAEIF